MWQWTSLWSGDAADGTTTEVIEFVPSYKAEGSRSTYVIEDR